ncbi:hypothetical protein GUITHDRAFT_145239 [Guillardia theta CCMP2712]|uniref:Uncharacterized protein n=1 Tax=Guillardia theta (strain CCMP2712) TaxID=905079 RepID=L1ILY2_GUITC|nr:hypothetical protein GUITHDRAFT_145239 [Guillardia theta CCMP2712]EKX37137.1 hypothetical protein GUITHDRAFT_145239 [Guillardia theta CCMP2712]|eukprot:XP_005824117.1 hypothetical protein GUITHDRAFT_145239 [Guillardia theta CCMP2712]
MQESREGRGMAGSKLVKIYETLCALKEQYGVIHGEEKDEDIARRLDDVIDCVHEFASTSLDDHESEVYAAAVKSCNEGQSDRHHEVSSSPSTDRTCEKPTSGQELKEQLKSYEARIAQLEEELDKSRKSHQAGGSLAAIQSPRNIDDLDTLRRYVLQAREMVHEKDEEIEELHRLMLEQRTVLEREMSSKMKVIMEDMEGQVGGSGAASGTGSKTKKGGKISAARYEEMASENARLKMQIQELRNALSSATRRSTNFLSGGSAKVRGVR